MNAFEYIPELQQACEIIVKQFQASFHELK